MKAMIQIVLLSGMALAVLSKEAWPQTVIKGGENISMQSSSLDRLVTGNAVSCKQCTIRGPVTAGGHVTLLDCPSVGSITAGSDVQLEKSHVLKGITAGDEVTLHHARVIGNITAGGNIAAEDSKIQGVINQGGLRLSMSRSESGSIRFSRYQNTYNTGISTNSIIGNNIMLNGGMLEDILSSSQITMGSHGISSVNGYLVKSDAGQTTLITPGQTVYINGRKVSGDGPDQYGDYLKKMPYAPRIHAPGWPEDRINHHDQPGLSAGQPSLELKDHSIVNGDVQFNGNPGLVIMDPSSRINGKVINGTVRKTNPASN